MNILVANDDGIHSPGIATLARVASRFGDVHVVAPDVEQSSASHAITASRPLTYRRTTYIPGVESWRVNGTPADCVALGIHNWHGVDIVLSGINRGVNLGNALWHSGTLAAAKQATLFGIRGIALSAPAETADGGEPDYVALEPHVERVLSILLASTGARLLNVNFPREPRGLTWTRQAVRHYDGRIVAGKDPMGRNHFWFTVAPLEQAEPGTDLWAMERGYISITPLSLDLTDQPGLASLAAAQPLDSPPIDEPIEKVPEHEPP